MEEIRHGLAPETPVASIEERRAALRAYVGCLRRSAKELDDGKSMRRPSRML